MQTTAEKIEVQQAYLDGKTVISKIKKEPVKLYYCLYKSPDLDYVRITYAFQSQEEYTETVSFLKNLDAVILEERTFEYYPED